MDSSPKKRIRNLGKTIVEALTQEQLAVLLELVCQPSILRPLMDSLEKIDEDVAETVEKIVFGKKEASAEADPGFAATASEGKILERWRSLWEQWNDLASELGDEHGRYAEQDEEWHPPYFDGDALSSDLEPLGEQMLEILEKVFDLVDDDDLFRDALEDLEYDIMSYPDYMGVEQYEGCYLGENVSFCALQWAWLASKSSENPGREFLERVFAMRNDNKMVSLSSDQIWDFFMSFPEDVCVQIYEALAKDPSKYKVDEARTFWHRLFHHFESLYDAASYLETCREHLMDEWRYGLPLIEDALARENYAETEIYLEVTFRSLMRRQKENEWRPEDELLIQNARFRDFAGEGDITRLLGTWEQVADKLDRPRRKSALLFQAGVYRFSEDWDEIFELRQSLCRPETDDTIGPLFEAWKSEMVKRSAGYQMRKHDPENNWVSWLLEARADIAKKREWFVEKVNAWLDGMNKSLESFRADLNWLAMFTKDAPGGDDLSERYPSFSQVVIDPHRRQESTLAKSRKKALAKLETGPCLESAIQVWKKRLASLIPSPAGNHGSQYDTHALWMNALYEIAPEDYGLVLARWREKHKRRKNLWRDMNARNLPL